MASQHGSLNARGSRTVSGEGVAHGSHEESQTGTLAQMIDRQGMSIDSMQQKFSSLVQVLIETGKLPGAPRAHKALADYIEYGQAIINRTTTVTEAITSGDLRKFALGLPSFSRFESRNDEIDLIDVQNMVAFDNCRPTLENHETYYHVDAVSHVNKLYYIAAINPRATEWLFFAAIMVQRGLSGKIIDMLVNRKDKFFEAALKDQAGNETTSCGIDPAMIAYSSTLDRLIVNVVTSLKSLDLGELGGELALDGELAETLDFEHYVTGDPVIFSVAKEAISLGLQFHDEPLLVESDSLEGAHTSKRIRLSEQPLTRQLDMGRSHRMAILRTKLGSSRYFIVNHGPTGRIPHARLVSGLLHGLTSIASPLEQRERLRRALEDPVDIHYALELDLFSGVGAILVDDEEAKGVMQYPSFSIENDLLRVSEPANITTIPDLPSLSPQPRNLELLNFTHLVAAGSRMANATIVVFLVAHGYWWSKQLIKDYPNRLFVPRHDAYFSAMACIGATMLHLEQNSGCEASTNILFDSLRLLTNLGGTYDSVSHEAITYAAQGPGGTLIHDILSDRKGSSSPHSFLAYRWLSGKFPGIPEVALFAHGCEWRKEIPTVNYEAVDSSPPPTYSMTVFADSTDGHTLSCGIVHNLGIRTLPFSRLLCGYLLAYIGLDRDCKHTEEEDLHSLMERHQISRVPLVAVLDTLYGKAELVDADNILITGANNNQLDHVVALAVSKAGTAIDTKGCALCAYSRSTHVIETKGLDQL